MPVILESGKGTGFKAEIDSDQRLVTRSIVETDFEYISDQKGESYVWASGTYDPDAGDTILLVKNTSATKELHIDSVWISTDTETRVVIHLPTTNVTVAGTTITGVNCNTSKNNVADAEAARDETGNSQGDVIWSGEVQAASDPYHINWAGACILAKNKSIGVDFVSATTACDVTITGHYTEIPGA